MPRACKEVKVRQSKEMQDILKEIDNCISELEDYKTDLTDLSPPPSLQNNLYVMNKYITGVIQKIESFINSESYKKLMRVIQC